MTVSKNILSWKSIFPSKLKKEKQLPDSIIDSKKDVGGTSGTYTNNSDNSSNSVQTGELFYI